MQTLRSALGLSQEKLAETLGCHHSLISVTEAGRSLGGVTTRKICDLYRTELVRLGLTAEDFLRGERFSPGAVRKAHSGDPAAPDRGV